jgi:SnoaL-like domain
MDRAREIEAIHQLKARYFRLMDTKQWRAYGELFTEDATLAASPDPKETFSGRAEIVRRVSAALREATTVHHGHMPEIELTGDHSATGIWAMYDFVDLPQLVLHGWGHYHDEYAKQDGTWRIRSSRLTRLRLDITPKPREEKG